MTTFFLCANFVHEQLPRCISSFKPGARWSYVNSCGLKLGHLAARNGPSGGRGSAYRGPDVISVVRFANSGTNIDPAPSPGSTVTAPTGPSVGVMARRGATPVDLVQSRSRGARSPAGARALRALVGARLDQRYWPPRRPSRRIPARLFLTTTSSWFVWAPPEYSSPCAG
jgi:hypothetical protein